MDNFSVLLVDDEKGFVDTLVKRLTKRGLTTFEAFSGNQALEAIENNNIDIVVLDVRMPGMDGLETLNKIKKACPLIEVILLTGHASIEVAIQGMESGAFDYLMKPMDINELVYKLQDALQRKRIQEDKIKNMEKELR